LQLLRGWSVQDGFLCISAPSAVWASLSYTPSPWSPLAQVRRSVRDHLAYISRDGEETVVNQDGQDFKGLDAVADLSWGWQHTGPKTPETSEHRLSFNVMFSMPEGNSERAVFETVKK
jgi:hypothetical protein